MHRPGEGSFEKGSHVLEYWLANSEGFALARPKSRRRVTAVVLDPGTRQARSLVVRRGRRTQVVSASTVTAVDPRRRVLYTAPRRRPVPRAAAQKSAMVAAELAKAAGTSTRSGVERMQPVVTEWARRTAAVTAAAYAVVQPIARAYAHNAAVIAGAYARAVLSRLRA